MTLPSPLNLTDIKHCFAGSVVYPPGGLFGPRIQQDVQLVMLYTGGMEVRIDDKTHHIRPGNVAILLPGHQESFRFAVDQETWHRWIAVRFHELSLPSLEYLNRMRFHVPLTEEMNRLTDLMLSMLPLVSTDSQLMRSLGLAALNMYPIETNPSSGKNEKHPSIYRTISWILDHYGEDVSLTTLASQSGVSPEHLIRLFRRYQKVTPMQYLWGFRIERAIELLIHTGLTVSEIALRCGFKTSHHFASMMKRQRGQTPTDIRNNHWTGMRKP